ncbi:MAG: hypothetical protein ROO73_01650 [Roseivirga sp.]
MSERCYLLSESPSAFLVLRKLAFIGSNFPSETYKYGELLDELGKVVALLVTTEA